MKAFLYSCAIFLSVSIYGYAQVYEVKEGVLDLRQYNFQEQGIVKLSGDWEFYWNELFAPEDLKNQPKDFFAFPKVWNNSQTTSGLELNNTGYATYRLKILLPGNSDRLLAFEMPDFYCNYTLWINGKIFCENGVVGKSRKESKPQWLPLVKSYYAESRTLDLVLQVSNFYHKYGGINDHIYLGTGQQIQHKREAQVITNILLGSGLVVVGLFFLVLYYSFNRNKAAMFFALLCITWAIRSLFTNLYLMINWFPNFEWELAVKIEYLTVYLAMIFSILFIHKLFHEDSSERFKEILVLLNAVFIVFTIASPAITYTYLQPFYIVVIWIILAFILFVVTKALIKRRAGVWFIAFSLLVAVAMFTYDTLMYKSVADFNPLLFNLGYILVFLLNGAGFAYKLSESLEQKNTGLGMG